MSARRWLRATCVALGCRVGMSIAAAASAPTRIETRRRGRPVSVLHRVRAPHRGAAAAAAPTWRYYHARLPSNAQNQPGVGHGGEIPAVGTGDRCGCLGAPLSPADRAAGAALAERWVSFARSGEPTASSGARWPTDSRARPVVLEFADAEEANPDFMKHRLNAFLGALNLIGAARPAN